MGYVYGYPNNNLAEGYVKCPLTGLTALSSLLGKWPVRVRVQLDMVEIGHGI